MDINILLQFLIAIAIGALIGIERQRSKKGNDFAGIRTFTFISFLGAICSFIFQELSYTAILPIVFISLAGLVIASFVTSAIRGYIGITAEVSTFVTFFLGFLVMFDDYRNYALIFSVFVTILLSFKDVLHKFIESAKDFEWNDTLKFALITFVILPLVPEKINLGLFEGRFTDLNIINLREIWLLVIFVSGISFIGYFLIKIIGGKKGANIIGAMGGMVSSTAVTQSMASHSKPKVSGRKMNYKPLVNAVLLATLVSFVRVGLISIGIDKNLYIILAPIVFLLIIGLLLFVVTSRNENELDANVKLKSPFRLKPAFILASLYAILTIVSKLSFSLELGKSGILVASVITGFFDMDPVILTVSSLSAAGTISINDAICSILLAIASNQVTKTFVAMTSGSKKFGRGVGRILLVFVVAIIAWVVFVKI
ncbi:MgtC/SapB family protein [Patescibacteria group bacterium]